MKPFMENICMHPYCREPDCKNCCHFKPKAFGIKIPKWLGNILFDLEEWLMSKQPTSGKF